MNKTIFIKLIGYGFGEKIIEMPYKSTVADLKIVIKATERTRFYKELQEGKSEEVGPNQILCNNDILLLITPKKAEAKIESIGRIWMIHQNDPDKIRPSDFHAHDVENGDKLDLYTGELYSKDFRLLKKIRNKKHKLILGKLREHNCFKEKVEKVLDSL